MRSLLPLLESSLLKRLAAQRPPCCEGAKLAHMRDQTGPETLEKEGKERRDQGKGRSDSYQPWAAGTLNVPATVSHLTGAP